MDIIDRILYSWNAKNGINTTDSILDWIKDKNNSLVVNIKKKALNDITDWYIDEESGTIRNINSSFFSITGFRVSKNDSDVYEQPIILQNEIGFLGIICKEINGILSFLMQAKIEPGNINKIQLSPTIQATKSNFEQKHGGNKPAYLDYFLNKDKYFTIVDQIQSEQSERFYKKRNRNIIILLDNEDIEVFPTHKWMTLGQIKELMKIDNLVNMDTRTVLSCIPFALYGNKEKYLSYFNNALLGNSIFNNDDFEIVKAFNKLNDYKMFCNIKTEFIKLSEIKNWYMHDNEFICKENNNFKVIFCELEIEGREVRKWSQPLFEATGVALFALFVSKFENKYKFLVKVMPECGTFDKVEFGPTIQNEAIELSKMPSSVIEKVCLDHLVSNKGVMIDVLLSEEGGRFYHEQNRNVIIEIDKDEIGLLPDHYIWLDFKTLNLLQQTNNVLNIQLRNLLSLMEI